MSSDPPRVLIAANPAKPRVADSVGAITRGLAGKAQVVGTVMELHEQAFAGVQADYVLALGGDGTILAVARAIGDHPAPIIGVNLGKLGYLAEFSIDELILQFDAIVSSPAAVSERTMLCAELLRADQPAVRHLAVNDVCTIAGAPFRTIEMEVTINHTGLTRLVGDGLILSTPTGSTAYNMSVGGPILLPKVRALVLSPIAPHALTFRPIVMDSESIVDIRMLRLNEGTTLVIDGQVSLTLQRDDLIRVRRHTRDFKLVHNPSRSPWHTLTTKLGWGLAPGSQPPAT